MGGRHGIRGSMGSRRSSSRTGSLRSRRHLLDRLALGALRLLAGDAAGDFQNFAALMAGETNGIGKRGTHQITVVSVSNKWMANQLSRT